MWNSMTKMAAICTAALLASMAVEAQVAGTGCADVRPLINWYSPSRGDNFGTTDPFWGGPIGVQRSPDYKARSNEGYVLINPRAGTVPVFHWASPSRGDNLLTSNPGWAGREGDTRLPDYRFVRVIGHIFDPARPQPVGTWPLDSSHSPSREDNISSSAPVWTGPIGKPNSPDYTLFRREGYVFDTRSFADCTHAIDERGTLPDFIVNNILLSTGQHLWVSVRNDGADGFVTQVACSTLGSAAVNDERFELLRGRSRLVRIPIWPTRGFNVNCGVTGVGNDGVTPEPSGPNNSLDNVPTF
jgi:hypothetical protein